MTVFTLLIVAFDVTATASRADQLRQIQAYYESSVLQRLHGTCTEDNVAVRRSWDNLNNTERAQYIDAVKCLRSLPAITPPFIAAGARNRIDDFTVSHVNQTLFIHFSGWLMPWHRFFVWQYEKALRDECGYRNYQPYWDWTTHSHNISASPLFDGSAFSLGGDGQYVPHGAVNCSVPGVPDLHYIYRPPGTGGGCVTNGPFANITLNLGPVFPYGEPNTTGYEYKPHCLTRDFLQVLSDNYLTEDNFAALLASPIMADFRALFDATSHIGGHASVGGDLSDVFSSPQDPAFFFHHAQADRVWALWQSADPANRMYAVSDTRTYANSPPSPNATIADVLSFGFVGGEVEMVNVMDTIAGPFCYRYE